MSGTTPTTGAEWVALQRRHIHAAQTATPANAAARLQQAIRTNTNAMVWASQHSGDSNASTINRLGRATIRVRSVVAAAAGKGGPTPAPTTGGKGGTTRTPARSGGGGGGGSAIPDLDIGGGLPQEASGLFSAITQTVRGEAENLPELWSPPGVGFFARPSTKLVMLITGVTITGLALAVALSSKPAPKTAKE